MLTDDDLRALIREAAASAPAPAPATASLFDDARPTTTRRLTWPRRRTLELAAVTIVLAVVAVIAVRSAGNEPSSKFSQVSAPVGGSAVPQTPSPATGTAGSVSGGTSTAGGAAQGSSSRLATPIAPLTDSARVVKNGSIELGVSKGALQATVDRIAAVASGFGGYVSGSQTAGGSENERASGTITVRVPSDAFDPMLTEIGRLGEVRSTTASGTNVTAQYTDLEARIGALQATHDQLLTILTQAESIPDILAVQDRLTDVQIQIDSLKGQLQVLADQTAYGTIAVSVLEPGATVAVAPVDENGDLGDAWSDARRRFGDGVETIVASSGTAALIAAVLAVLGVVAWMVARLVRRRLV